MNCPKCDGPLIQKNRNVLLLVGGILIAAALAMDFLSLAFLAFAFASLAAGAYLVVWATYGKALWCRACKTFPMGGINS